MNEDETESAVRLRPRDVAAALDPIADELSLNPILGPDERDRRPTLRMRLAPLSIVTAVAIAITAASLSGCTRQHGAVAPSRQVGVPPTHPAALAAGLNGDLLISDPAANKVFALLPGGTFQVIAGDGEAGFSGDGGLALRARLNRPVSLAVASNGTLYIADEGNNRIRAVLPNGRITTVARVSDPLSLSIGPKGALWIASGNASEILKLYRNKLTIAVSRLPQNTRSARLSMPNPGCDPSSIAWVDGLFYMGCSDPFELYVSAHFSSWRSVAPMRPHDTDSALATSGNTVFGLYQNAIIMVRRSRLLATYRIGARSLQLPFWPSGIVVLGRRIYLDQGGGGGVGPPAIASATLSTPLRLRLVWRSGEDRAHYK